MTYEVNDIVLWHFGDYDEMYVGRIIEKTTGKSEVWFQIDGQAIGLFAVPLPHVVRKATEKEAKDFIIKSLKCDFEFKERERESEQFWQRYGGNPML